MTGSRPSGVLVDGRTCCSPLGEEPLTQEQAKRLAITLKVLAEPSRLRLISAMVSTLAPAALRVRAHRTTRVVAADRQPPSRGAP